VTEERCEICEELTRNGRKFRVALGVNSDGTLKAKHDHAILESLIASPQRKTLTKEEREAFRKWKERGRG